MTIRVTHIYGRINGERYLVHRHADFPPSDQRARDQGRRIRARLISVVLLTAARKRTLSKARPRPSGSRHRFERFQTLTALTLRYSLAKGAGP